MESLMRVSSPFVTDSDNLLPWEYLKSYYHFHESDTKGKEYNVGCIICGGFITFIFSKYRRGI
jgi:hypothetical protein